MMIQVPWKIRLRSGHQASPHSDPWWKRMKFHGDPESANSPTMLREDDFDHLGKLHKSIR